MPTTKVTDNQLLDKLTEVFRLYGYEGASLSRISKVTGLQRASLYHRFPGGIAFTANSAGHMIAVRDWYEGKDSAREWALKQAMLTINNAMPTRKTDSAEPSEQGRVTWLRPLDSEGKPLVSDIECPLARIPTALEGKDWTRYEGVLHTDHAVREEFFLDREVAPTASKPYLMDFAYLYDESQDDFIEFTGGKLFTVEQVFEEIGRPEDWTHRAGRAVRTRSDEEASSVAEQLHACRRWEALFEPD